MLQALSNMLKLQGTEQYLNKPPYISALICFHSQFVVLFQELSSTEHQLPQPIPSAEQVRAVGMRGLPHGYSSFGMFSTFWGQVS